MANPSRRRGTEWEGRVASFFNARNTFGVEVFRAPLWGALDKGDLVNTGDFVVQCKAVKSIDLARFLDEVETQRKNAGRKYGVVVVKRRSHDAAKAYVVQPLDQFAEIAGRLNGLGPED
jgi:hypothetical protein